MRLLILLFVSINIYSYEPFVIKHYDAAIPCNSECYIGADLGGTNMDFGVFSIQNDQPVLLFSLHTKSKTITDFTQVIKDVLEYAYDNYAISIYKACIAVPGTPKDNYAFHPYYYYFNISEKSIVEQTSLTAILLLTDSLVIGYGLEYLGENSIVPLFNNQSDKHMHNKNVQKATINIGTGLGSSAYSWDSGLHGYISHPSRVGRMEFAPINQDELEVMQHVKKITKCNSVFWTNLVSGLGIKNIYTALRAANKYYDSLCLADYDGGIIFAHPEDDLCAATKDLFCKLLVRCVRNYVAAVLPVGGLYLAGGIVTKNAEYIAATFAQEYAIVDAPLQEIIHSVPVYMVTDYNVSLYGAMHYLLMHGL